MTEKKSYYTNLAFYWVIFNPISLVAGFTNLGSFNDALFYIVTLLPLFGDEEAPFLNSAGFCAFTNAMLAYFDPRLLFVTIPLTVIQSRFHFGDRKQEQA